MKNTRNEMKNTLQGIDCGVDEIVDQIRDLEDEEAETTQLEQRKDKRIPPNEDSVISLWDNFKHTNIHIMGVLEGKYREQEIENLCEKMMGPGQCGSVDWSIIPYKKRLWV